MTVAIDCKECGSEVAFWFGESETPPTETCECGGIMLATSDDEWCIECQRENL